MTDASVFNLTLEGMADIGTYITFGGFQGLRKALAIPITNSLDMLMDSGLRGRGGAAFPTGVKIKAVRENESLSKYIVCNADEGEPGTFKDRYLIKKNPFLLLEGMIIAAYLAGANKGYIYVRHEYPEAQQSLKASIETAEKEGFLGKNILDSGFDLTLEIFSGAGSYLCGEETAMLSSIEGKKGRPRLKPPYPTTSGLWGKPTLINNVETLCNIPRILQNGPVWYHSFGTEYSRGTKLISLSGDVNHRGVFEVPYGTTFREIIEHYGGGIKDGKNIKAVNIGGASGVLVPPSRLNVALDYKACREEGITIGSGAIFVLDETRSIIENVQNRVEFFLHESCGKCTPCREGLRQSNFIIDKVLAGKATVEDIDTLDRYTRTMQRAAFCGLGMAAGNSLSSSLEYYREEYLSYSQEGEEDVQEVVG